MGIEQLAFFWFNCLVVCFLVLGLLYVSLGIVSRFIADDSLSVRWCAVIVVGLWIATVGFHVLAVIGIFRVWSVVVIIICSIGIVRLSGYSLTELMSSIRGDVACFKDFLVYEINPMQKCLLVILATGALLVAGRGCILPLLAWDALTYHAVKAGMWVQNGHIGLMEAPGAWFYSRNFLGGGEGLKALGMLPFHDDFLICLVDFVQWLSLREGTISQYS